MNTFKASVLAAITALLFAGSAHGTIVYSYVPNQSNFFAAPGVPITVNIYLQETLTSASTSILQPANENGLFGAAFKVTEVPNSLASPTVISAITPNTDAASQQFNGGPFNIANVTPAVGSLSEAESISNTQGVELGNQPTLAGGITTPANEIFLGTVTLTVGTSPGPTVFNLGAYGVSGSTVTYNDTDDLDKSGPDGGGTGESYTGVGNTISTITVNAPEPASLDLIGLVSAVGLLRRRTLKDASSS